MPPRPFLPFRSQNPRAGNGLSLLRGARCSAGRKLPRGKVSRACRRMGHGKNASLLPTQVAAGTLKKVWWKCPKGHSYFASVASRVRGSGCPACGGKTVVPGENDLATPFSHSHQTLRLLPGVTCCGVRLPLRVGCHCEATTGSMAARSLKPGRTLRLAQNGQSLPLRTRWEMAAG